MQLNSNKLHVKLSEKITSTDPVFPRCYTLTHSDSTGDLFLTIGESFDRGQISGWYTRFMRDEVLAEWQVNQGNMFLLVHCHLSGGLILGTASWRYQIFQRELPLAFEAFRYGDRHLFIAHPEIDQALVKVKFHATRSADQREEQWGNLREYSHM
jgi:magnesium dechelatase